MVRYEVDFSPIATTCFGPGGYYQVPTPHTICLTIERKLRRNSGEFRGIQARSDSTFGGTFGVWKIGAWN